VSEFPELPAWAAPAFCIPGTYTRQDCGCQSWCQVDPEDSQNTFIYWPCSLTCANYQWAIGESRKQGNKIEYRRVS
jgi:hypothetical protein